MASNACKEGISDGSCKLSHGCSCIELLKQSFDEESEHCSLDIFPILFEEAAFPVKEKCLLQGSHGEDVYSISVVPDKGYTGPESSPEVAFLSVLEVSKPPNNQACLDSQLTQQNCIDLQMDDADDYSPCILDMDIEKGKPETPKPIENAANVNTEGAIPRVLRRQESVKLGERFVQLLMTQGSMLLNFSLRDKPVTERFHDAPSNRWRKYKRAASFDSRKIVLLFSILSSFGTLILIYLTLRVRQAGDGFVSS